MSSSRTDNPFQCLGLPIYWEFIKILERKYDLSDLSGDAAQWHFQSSLYVVGILAEKILKHLENPTNIDKPIPLSMSTQRLIEQLWEVEDSLSDVLEFLEENLPPDSTPIVVVEASSQEAQEVAS